MPLDETNPTKDAQIPLEDIEDGGADDVDNSVFPKHGGLRADKNTDQSTVDVINEATTPRGGIAVGGGKLAGNKDDFEGDLVYHERVKPGADPNNGVTPAHDMVSSDKSGVSKPGNRSG